MDERPATAPSPLRLRPALVAAFLLMVVWLVAYWNLGDLSWDLVQISSSGPRALALYVTGRYKDAARAYRLGQHGKLRAQYTDDPSGYWALRAGDLAEAERRANTTLALVPGSTEALITLGEIALDRGDVSRAAAAFRAALRRQPDHVDSLLLAAVASGRLGQPGPGIDALNRALRSGSAGRRDTVLFRVLELVGELSERPAAQQPLCLLAHLHRYLRIFDDGQGPVAMDYARRAIRANDRPADAYLTLGVVHDKRGEYADARRAIRRAIEIDPRHAEALRWLAFEAYTMGDVRLEYQLYKATFEAAPSDAYYYWDLERVLLVKLGDPLGMARLMERAVALDPANADAHARLARAADAPGDQARARSHRARAAALRGPLMADPQ